MRSPCHPLGKYTCLEITLTGRSLRSREKEQVRELFMKSGIPLAELACTDYKGLFRWSYYAKSFRKADRIWKYFRKAPVKNVRLRIKRLERRDWFDKWKEDYHIRSLGRRFLIVPVWEKDQVKKSSRIPVFLDPGSAFGSGYHETTRLMVRLLESLPWKDSAFLDIGTGTGILSVVAFYLGAGKVTGFDNDKPSALAAGKNYLLNGGKNGEFFCANLKNLALQEKFEVVGANLLSKTLLEHQKTLCRCVKRGGYLLVSGIAKENLAPFRKGFRAGGMKCLKCLKGRKWGAFLYKKTDV